MHHLWSFLVTFFFVFGGASGFAIGWLSRGAVERADRIKRLREIDREHLEYLDGPSRYREPAPFYDGEGRLVDPRRMAS